MRSPHAVLPERARISRGTRDELLQRMGEIEAQLSETATKGDIDRLESVVNRRADEILGEIRCGRTLQEA